MADHSLDFIAWTDRNALRKVQRLHTDNAFETLVKKNRLAREYIESTTCFAYTP